MRHRKKLINTSFNRRSVSGNKVDFIQEIIHITVSQKLIYVLAESEETILSIITFLFSHLSMKNFYRHKVDNFVK